MLQNQKKHFLAWKLLGILIQILQEYQIKYILNFLEAGIEAKTKLYVQELSCYEHVTKIFFF
jgi:hypothetical protein